MIVLKFFLPKKLCFREWFFQSFIRRLRNSVFPFRRFDLLEENHLNQMASIVKIMNLLAATITALLAKVVAVRTPGPEF